MKTLFMGMISVSLTIACTNEETPTAVETRTAEGEESDKGTGVSFGMERDSLEEEVEEVWFGAKDWNEDDMGVDL